MKISLLQQKDGVLDGPEAIRKTGLIERLARHSGRSN